MSTQLFAEQYHLDFLSALGDNLEKLDKAVNWNIFIPKINESLNRSNGAKGGRPAFNSLKMFKAVVVQKYFNLSDEALEFRLNDSLSFMRFTGFEFGEKMPDARTIWKFKEILTNAGVMEELFDIFQKELEKKNLIAHEGCIVDATFTEVPRNRNSKDDNEKLKKGEIPQDWTENKIKHKDLDAKWTKKRNEVHYGYKNHIKVDKDSKLIIGYTTTPANVHDSVEISKLVTEEDKIVYADAGYVGCEEDLPEITKKVICEKGYRNHPLTEEQKRTNREKSKTRCRVEHVFGFMKKAMNNSMRIRSIGMKRAQFNISLSNLLYNILRAEFLQRTGGIVG